MSLLNRPTPSACSFCKKPMDQVKSCARCMMASYCGKECQVNAWSSHRLTCKKELYRVYDEEIERIRQMCERQQHPQDLEFWGKVKKLHTLRWGFSTIKDFIEKGPRGAQEQNDAILIYATMGSVAKSQRKYLLALEYFEQLHEVIGEVKQVHWTRRNGIITDYAECLGRTGTDPSNEKPIRLMRALISETEGGAKRDPVLAVSLGVYREVLATALAYSNQKEDRRAEIMKLLGQMDETSADVIIRKGEMASPWEVVAAVSLALAAARLYRRIDDPGRAEHLLRRVIDVDKSFPTGGFRRKKLEAMGELAQIYETKVSRWQESEDLYRQLLAEKDLRFQDFVTYLHRVSVILVKQERFGEAIAFRTEKIEEAKRVRQSLDSAMLINLTLDTSRLHEVSGNLAEAVSIDTKVEEMGPRVMSQVPLSHRLAMLRRSAFMAEKNGDRAEAIAKFRRVLELVPENWEKVSTYDSLQAMIIPKVLDLLLKDEGIVEEEYFASLTSRFETIKERAAKVREEVFGEIREESQGRRPKNSKAKKKKKGARKTAQPSSVASEPEGEISSPEDGIAEGKQTSEEFPDECPICLMELEDEDDESDSTTSPLKALSCSHKFHAVCLSAWFQKCEQRKMAKSCPYCRNEDPLSAALF